MTATAYLLSVIRRNSVPVGQGSYAYKAAQGVIPIIRKWANVYLRAIRLSGSYAKNTAIRGKTDIDIFVSLKSNTKETLEEVFDLLYQWMVKSGYMNAQKQNVSVHINQAGVDVDIVPGIKFPGITEDHWLYVKKSGSERVKTNINKHITYVTVQFFQTISYFLLLYCGKCVTFYNHQTLLSMLQPIIFNY